MVSQERYGKQGEMFDLIVVQHHVLYLGFQERIIGYRFEIWQYIWNCTMILGQLCQSRKISWIYRFGSVGIRACIFYYLQIGFVYSFHNDLLKVYKFVTGTVWTVP